MLEIKLGIFKCKSHLILGKMFNIDVNENTIIKLACGLMTFGKSSHLFPFTRITRNISLKIIRIVEPQNIKSWQF